MRRQELEASCGVLKISDLEMLDYADSGMMGWPGNDAPGSFWQTPVEEGAARLAALMRHYRPDVVVTYDENGFYGHPDHIQAHRVAMYAAALAAVPSYRLDLGEPWDVAKVYWVAMSERRMRDSLRALREAGDTQTFEGMEPDGDLPPFITPDDLISTRIDGSAFVEQKMTALAESRPAMATTVAGLGSRPSSHKMIEISTRFRSRPTILAASTAASRPRRIGSIVPAAPVSLLTSAALQRDG